MDNNNNGKFFFSLEARRNSHEGVKAKTIRGGLKICLREVSKEVGMDLMGYTNVLKEYILRPGHDLVRPGVGEICEYVNLAMKELSGRNNLLLTVVNTVNSLMEEYYSEGNERFRRGSNLEDRNREAMIRRDIIQDTRIMPGQGFRYGNELGERGFRTLPSRNNRIQENEVFAGENRGNYRNYTKQQEHFDPDQGYRRSFYDQNRRIDYDPDRRRSEFEPKRSRSEYYDQNRRSNMFEYDQNRRTQHEQNRRISFEGDSKSPSNTSRYRREVGYGKVYDTSSAKKYVRSRDISRTDNERKRTANSNDSNKTSTKRSNLEDKSETENSKESASSNRNNQGWGNTSRTGSVSKGWASSNWGISGATKVSASSSSEWGTGLSNEKKKSTESISSAVTSKNNKVKNKNDDTTVPTGNSDTSVVNTACSEGKEKEPSPIVTSTLDNASLVEKEEKNEEENNKGKRNDTSVVNTVCGEEEVSSNIVTSTSNNKDLEVNDKNSCDENVDSSSVVNTRSGREEEEESSPRIKLSIKKKSNDGAEIKNTQKRKRGDSIDSFKEYMKKNNIAEIIDTEDEFELEDIADRKKREGVSSSDEEREEGEDSDESDEDSDDEGKKERRKRPTYTPQEVSVSVRGNYPVKLVEGIHISKYFMLWLRDREKIPEQKFDNFDDLLKVKFLMLNEHIFGEKFRKDMATKAAEYVSFDYRKISYERNREQRNKYYYKQKSPKFVLPPSTKDQERLESLTEFHERFTGEVYQRFANAFAASNVWDFGFQFEVLKKVYKVKSKNNIEHQMNLTPKLNTELRKCYCPCSKMMVRLRQASKIQGYFQDTQSRFKGTNIKTICKVAGPMTPQELYEHCYEETNWYKKRHYSEKPPQDPLHKILLYFLEFQYAFEGPKKKNKSSIYFANGSELSTGKKEKMSEVIEIKEQVDIPLREEFIQPEIVDVDLEEEDKEEVHKEDNKEEHEEDDDMSTKKNNYEIVSLII